MAQNGVLTSMDPEYKKKSHLINFISVTNCNTLHDFKKSVLIKIQTCFRRIRAYHKFY